jgi:protein SCO1/2
MKCLLLVMILILCGAACMPTPTPTLVGTNLQKMAAPDFALKDSNDKPFKLSEQKGNVVVLTFLYTNCPDECPLIVQRLREANEQLGKDRNEVKFIAVSLDPERDTREAINTYLHAQKVDHILTYLYGTRPELAAIWKAYFISPGPGQIPTAIFHQSRVIVIDRQGLQRSNFRSDLETEALVNDVRLVLQEK